MKRREKLLTVAAAVFVVAALTSLTIFAATNSGTQSDPLITLSYLNEKFAPQIKSDLAGELAAAGYELTKKFDAAVASGAPAAPATGSAPQTPPEGGGADVFSVVTLADGQTVKCSIGTEVLLRVGTASAVGETPGLVDSTAGLTLAPAKALEKNHLYMVTIESNGFKATSDVVKVMVRGDYTIG
jgi:hypothetical protein